MKIWIYAIAKNERRTLTASWRRAPRRTERAVLDTGSEDGTVERLRSLGADVGQLVIKPWRFDVARNVALEMVPSDADVCLALDLDEVLAPGWREAIEAAWSEGTTRGRYLYVWSHDMSGGDGVTFFADKMHARHGYHWRYPVHEVLTTDAPEMQCVIPGLRIDHWPDSTQEPRLVPAAAGAGRARGSGERPQHALPGP